MGCSVPFNHLYLDVGLLSVLLPALKSIWVTIWALAPQKGHGKGSARAPSSAPAHKPALVFILAALSALSAINPQSSHTGIRELPCLREWFLSSAITQIRIEWNYSAELKSQEERAVNQNGAQNPPAAQQPPFICCKDKMLLIPDRNCTSRSHTRTSKNTEGNINQNWRRQSARFYFKLTVEIKRSTSDFQPSLS